MLEAAALDEVTLTEFFRKKALYVENATLTRLD
jgi:hypothetical protein